MKRYRRLLHIVILLLTSFAVFSPVLNHEFLNYDDNIVVTDNAAIREGLTPDGVAWAFTTTYALNWTPLTWLSHMLDVELFGFKPMGHHLMSLLLHSVNAALLYLVLWLMTRAEWRCFLVAILFAVHPLHVESVAWVTERRDVLSTFFWILAMGAYHFYARRPSWPRYCVLTALYTMGLLSKPMLVTFPFVLLLLDFWPMRRHGRLAPAARTVTVGYAPAGMWRLIAEKLPLLALAIAVGVVTLSAQKTGGALIPLDSLPFWTRIGNAVVSYASYLGKTAWPRALAIFYPHRALGLQWAEVVRAGLLFAAASAVAVVNLKGRPYLATGWFWYVGTLAPVIGIVQVGLQSSADRFTYVSLIGIFLALSWWLGDLSGAVRWRRWCVGTGSTVAVAVLMAAAWVQAGYWRDSKTVFLHAMEVTENNYLAYDQYGFTLAQEGRFDEALPFHREAVRINPLYSRAQNNLGVALEVQGDIDQAAQHYQRAIEIDPSLPEFFINLGWVRFRQGGLEEAAGLYERALLLQPDSVMAHVNLGMLRRRQGRDEEAEAHYREARRLKSGLNAALAVRKGQASPAGGEWGIPGRRVAAGHEGIDMADYNHRQGQAALDRGSDREALEYFREALVFDPDHTGVHNDLGNIYYRQGDFETAASHFQQALQADDGFAKAHSNLGAALFQLDRTEEAVRHFTAAMELDPESLSARFNLASVLLETGDLKQSAALFREILARHPEHALSHHSLGKVLFRQGRPDEAAVQYERALKLNPDLAEAHVALGLVLMKKGRHAEAAGHFGEALRIRPGFAEAKTLLEQSLSRQAD